MCPLLIATAATFSTAHITETAAITGAQARALAVLAAFVVNVVTI